MTKDTITEAQIKVELNALVKLIGSNNIIAWLTTNALKIADADLEPLAAKLGITVAQLNTVVAFLITKAVAAI